MYKIIENSIRCNSCGDILISFEGETKKCSCGKCGVSGGRNHLSRIGNKADWEERSVVMAR